MPALRISKSVPATPRGEGVGSGKVAVVMLLMCPALFAVTRKTSQPVTLPATGPGVRAVATRPVTTGPASRPAVPLPVAWHGHFVGTLSALSADKPDAVQAIPAELIIAPIPGTPDVEWTLVYNVEQRQERRYRLNAVPGYPGRYLMDERNGLMIDHVLVRPVALKGEGDAGGVGAETARAEVLTCHFALAETLLTSRFELRGDELYFEILSSSTARPRRTGVKETEIRVDSFPIRSIQRGTLKRKPGDGGAEGAGR